MKLLYYPGCTLRTTASDFDRSAKKCAEALGIELVELQDITCCGALFPQTTENLMLLLAPARVLVQAQRQQIDGTLMTLCSFCYNTLKRANTALIADQKKLSVLSEFLEEPYKGKIKVVHFLEVLRDTIGFESVRAKVSNGSVAGMRVAPYYGCLLLRPSKELGLDDPEQPTVLEDLLGALGCEVIDFSLKTECCGSFLIVNNPAAAEGCSRRIVQRLQNVRADALVTSCPLCFYNITRINTTNGIASPGERPLILYFTQLMGLAFGIEARELGISAEYSKIVSA